MFNQRQIMHKRVEALNLLEIAKNLSQIGWVDINNVDAEYVLEYASQVSEVYIRLVEEIERLRNNY